MIPVNSPMSPPNLATCAQVRKSEWASICHDGIRMNFTTAWNNLNKSALLKVLNLHFQEELTDFPVGGKSGLSCLLVRNTLSHYTTPVREIQPTNRVFTKPLGHPEFRISQQGFHRCQSPHRFFFVPRTLHSCQFVQGHRGARKRKAAPRTIFQHQKPSQPPSAENTCYIDRENHFHRAGSPPATVSYLWIKYRR